MRVETIDLIPLRLPLRMPWRTSGGTMTEREVVLVHLRSDVGDGWGECAAFETPFYSSEFVRSAVLALRDHLAPRLLSAAEVSSDSVASLLAPVNGHRMAKSALEMAVLDAELRATNQSFGSYLGVTRTRIDAGVALGLTNSPGELCDMIAARSSEGYRRVKLKIEPDRDLEWVRAARARFPKLTLAVDANGAYRSEDFDHLARFDEFGLAFLEQPLHDEDLLGHVHLAEILKTPICLDEPLVSLGATKAAVALGACEVVNLKPGRVGGYLEARRIHDWCVSQSVPLWCGGMLETGVARTANVVLAALDGFTITGDLSGSDRFYDADIVTEPIRVIDGSIDVPAGPGLGFEIDPDAIARFRIS